MQLKRRKDKRKFEFKKRGRSNFDCGKRRKRKKKDSLKSRESKNVPSKLS